MIGTLVGQAAQPAIARIVGELSYVRAIQSYDVFVCVAATLVLQGVPAFFMGVFFPALAHWSQAPGRGAGRAVGTLYGWNTAGAILGACFTAALLLPLLGTFGSALAMLAVYALAAFLATSALDAGTRGSARGVVGLLSLGLALGGLVLWPDLETVKRLNIGAYFYRHTATSAEGIDSDVLFFEESATCNVLVLSRDIGREEPFLSLRVNGKVDGSSGDMDTQLGLAYLPRLLRRTPRTCS